MAFIIGKKALIFGNLLDFISDGKVTINEVLSKPNYFGIYQNKLMCCVDSTAKALKKFEGLTLNKYTLDKD